MRPIDADALKGDYVVTSTTTNSLCNLYVSMEQIAMAPTVEPASPWHRVEEEPKESGKQYVVWASKGYAYCDKWLGDRWLISSVAPETVTYWMPIEPPKEDA